QTMTPQHQRGELLARCGQRDARIRFVAYEAGLGERLDHGGGRPRRDAERRRKLAHRQQALRSRQRRDTEIDRFEVVLDGAGRQHGESVGYFATTKLTFWTLN